MLWAYFDESGEHEPSGQLAKLTLGGSIASYDTWKIVEGKWDAILERYDIEMFHMADFEANKGEFDGWDKTDKLRRKHRDLLNDLLDICCEHLHFHVGLISTHPEGGQFKDTYKLSVVDSLLMMRTKIVSMDRSPFSLVYAKQPEFSLSKLEQVFNDVGQNHPAIRTCTIGDPICLPQLQVADIVAYEISRRHRRQLHQRYPWDRLASNAGILLFRDDASVPAWEGRLS